MRLPIAPIGREEKEREVETTRVSKSYDSLCHMKKVLPASKGIRALLLDYRVSAFLRTPPGGIAPPIIRPPFRELELVTTSGRKDLNLNSLSSTDSFYQFGLPSIGLPCQIPRSACMQTVIRCSHWPYMRIPSFFNISFPSYASRIRQGHIQRNPCKCAYNLGL